LCFDDLDCAGLFATPPPCWTGRCVNGLCQLGHDDDGTPCEDGIPCTAGETCAAGYCVGGDAGCDDADPCTSDFCGLSSGVCEHEYNGLCPECFTQSSAEDFASGTFMITQPGPDTGVTLQQDDGGFAPSGSYLSPVIDAGMEASWESIHWSAQPALTETEGQPGLPDGGVILLLHLDDGGEPVADSSGNDHHGMNYGAVPNATGKMESAYEFIDTGGYAEVPHHEDFLLDQGTVSFWFNATDVAPQQGLFSKDSLGLDGGGHLTISISDYIGPKSGDKTDSPHVWARLQSTEGGNFIISDAVEAGVWYQVVFTWGPEGMKLYLNGELQSADEYDGGLGASAGGSGNHEPIVIGASTRHSADGSAQPTDDHFRGVLDEVIIYDYPLAPGDVAHQYALSSVALELLVRGCDNAACEDAEFQPLSGQSPQPLDLFHSRFFQYRFDFVSENPAFSPHLQEVEVCRN